jgi:protein-L-isoaspartate(D-aspartate) O-methyltransferase
MVRKMAPWMDQAAIAGVGSPKPRARRVSQPQHSEPGASRSDSVEVLATARLAKDDPGLASDAVRLAMVESLGRAGVRDAGVLETMRKVPRHRFVEPGLASRAYEDVALPIGHGQTISRPFTVARMIELVAAPLDTAARSGASVLEIGTGCGYQAAVLAGVFGQVVSIERIRGLHEQARANLRGLRLSNLRLVFGDGQHGVEQAAPYDVIIAAAAGGAIPQAWLRQMRLGGQLIAPVSQSGRQALHLVQRTASDRWQLMVLDAVRFVPLREGTA